MTDKFTELATQVQNSKEGITPEQLKALLEAEMHPAPTQQATVEPAPAPAPQAPVGTPAATPAPAVAPAPAPAAPAPEPTQGQPDFMSLIPERFRSKDVPTSLSNITKQYSELETDLRKQKDEVANLNKLVQSFVEREPAAPPTQVQPTQVEDVSDEGFFEKPTENVKKIAAQMAQSQILAYHMMQEKKKFVEGFKAQHTDFETYREDMQAILRARPDLDRDERNLPMVFELAKQRYNSRMSAMRKELGLDTQTTPAHVEPAPKVDIEAIVKAAYAKAAKDLADGIEARRAASGIQGTSPAVSPEVRVQPRELNQPLTPQDKLIEEMMGSGPKRYSWLDNA